MTSLLQAITPVRGLGARGRGARVHVLGRLRGTPAAAAALATCHYLPYPPLHPPPMSPSSSSLFCHGFSLVWAGVNTPLLPSLPPHRQGGRGGLTSHAAGAGTGSGVGGLGSASEPASMRTAKMAGGHVG